MVVEQDVVDNAATAENEATVLRRRFEEYDRAGQLSAQTDATGYTTLYAYDAHGNRVGTRNALGRNSSTLSTRTAISPTTACCGNG